ncbi:hypothetical protein TNIN_133831 [Trichonephila inaurata madagascariensis]|uniref:Uncharacterized protein n=1 Tax=Trichonephila inaurata madagascariensis TaxID=2747483 RepID=A0A8X6IU74_9ARAC|nr:hypothetical protein TNIN_133831 [Trichonephila inaurata madagascariensis]
MDTLKSLRMKLSDIQNEYYEAVENDRALATPESEILDLEDDGEYPGAEATLANIRNSLWIPSVRNVARKKFLEEASPLGRLVLKVRSN